MLLGASRRKCPVYRLQRILTVLKLRPYPDRKTIVAPGLTETSSVPHRSRSTKWWRQKPVGVRAVELDPPWCRLASFNAVVALARQRSPGRPWRDVALATACSPAGDSGDTARRR